jgi:cation:H+ antiporter
MMIAFGLLLLGGTMLYFGAEWLVRGAAGMALAFGVRQLVIGLTVVSYGTSAPELAVSVLAALEGKSAIALGNVIGSNIANVGLILGVTTLVAPPRAEASMIRRELPIMIAACAVVPLLLRDGSIGRTEGLALTLAGLLFTWVVFRWSGGSAPHVEELPPAEGRSTLALAALVLVGLALLVGGGHAVVSGAVELAQRAGMSERVVALTIVAVGTSLPELAASLVAALRGHSELALGNVVGSNIYNIVFILGVASLVHPIAGPLAIFGRDLVAMIIFALLAAASMSRPRRIGRAEGALYVGLYAGFLVVLGFLQ